LIHRPALGTGVVRTRHRWDWRVTVDRPAAAGFASALKTPSSDAICEISNSV
jgi:hypothetical protein